MKRKIVLVLILALFVSGCTSTKNRLLSTVKIDVVSPKTEDISVVAEIPSFAREGQTFLLNVEINPKHDIKNVSFSVYDKSPYIELVEGENDKWEVSFIPSNKTKIFQTKYKVKELEFDREVDVKFLLEYNSSTTLTEEIPILDDFEYEDRYSKGTLKEIKYHSYSQDSPLKIKITFDKERPFINDTRILMYINYFYSGSGIIDKLEKGSVNITLPQNLEYIECRDYDNENGVLILNKDKQFINKEAVESTCEIRTNGKSPISTGTLTLSANYHYKITGRAGIELRKR